MLPTMPTCTPRSSDDRVEARNLRILPCLLLKMTSSLEKTERWFCHGGFAVSLQCLSGAHLLHLLGAPILNSRCSAAQHLSQVLATLSLAVQVVQMQTLWHLPQRGQPALANQSRHRIKVKMFRKLSGEECPYHKGRCVHALAQSSRAAAATKCGRPCLQRNVRYDVCHGL